MIISPFEVKKSLFPKKFAEIEEKAERGTCHLDWRGVLPMPLPLWTWETPREQDGSKSTDNQQVEES